MADLTYGELANMTYAELANSTYALESGGGGGGGETSCVWTAEKVSEIMSELDSLTTEVAALKTQMNSLSSALANAVSTLKTYGDTNWRTATGFATPADVQLTTTTETVEVVSQTVDLNELKAYGDSRWATASGFATPEDVKLTTTTETVNVTTQQVDLTELKAYGDSRWATAEGFATSAELNAVAAGRTLADLAAPEDVKLTTTTETVEVVSQTVDLSDLKSYGDEHWATAVGFATPDDVKLTTTTEVVEVVTQDVNLGQILSHGDLYWKTATGFATPSDVTLTTTTQTVEVVSQEVDLTELKAYGDANWKTAEGFVTEVPTAAQIADSVWGYTWGGGLLVRDYVYGAYHDAGQLYWNWNREGARISTIDTAVAALKAYGDAGWKTAEGFATPEDVKLTTTTETVEVVTQTVDFESLKVYGDQKWATAAGFATPAEVEQIVAGHSNETAGQLDLLLGLTGNWTEDGNRLVTYTPDGTAAYVLTKNTAGEVTSCRPE